MMRRNNIIHLSLSLSSGPCGRLDDGIAWFAWSVAIVVSPRLFFPRSAQSFFGASLEEDHGRAILFVMKEVMNHEIKGGNY